MKSVVKFPPLRDNFVDIIWTSIATGQSNFIKRSSSNVLNYGPYDYGSVMHYGGRAFSKDDKSLTIETKDPRNQRLLGQRDRLSDLDVKLIKKMYRCN